MRLQNSRKRSSHELRCVCLSKPLLAIYGLDNGELYIHVKVYKSNRLYAELVVTKGEVKIHCRVCSRWHKIIIRARNKAELEPDKRPEFLGFN